MKQFERFSKRLFAAVLCTALLCTVCAPVMAVQAPDTLRVAFYPLEGFFEYDGEGNKTGYGVELLDKLSQYTGIHFKYVPAESWESTRQMLTDGKADLRMPATKPVLPPETMSYNSASIIDTYDVMLALNTREDLFYQDYETIKKLKIAVSRSFYNANSVKDYFDDIGVTPEQIVFCSEYDECREKLVSGEVDALVSNIMDMESNMKMLARFNSISNHFSMSHNNPVLGILDEALSQIKLDEPLFLSSLYEKWFPERTNIPLTFEESEYLASVDTITFAFQPNEGYLSRCENGEFYGIYTEMAKSICEKLNVGYRAVSIPDCLNGAKKTDVYAGFFYDQNYAHEWNFSLSSPINDINYYIIQKKETTFDPDNCRIAAIKKFKYTSDYLQKQYGDSEFIYFDTYEKCLQAVANGIADITVINNYIAEYYLGMYQFSDLGARLSSDYSHLFCFAAADNNELLANILTKAISMISDAELNKLYILGQEQKPSSNYLQAAMYQNPLQFTLFAAGVITLVFITLLLLCFARKSKKQNRELEKALCAKSSFLARMSHDMRTPMNGILGLTYLMEKHNSIEEIKEYIPQLRESGEYLLRLINDVLDVSKIESGKLTLNPRVCDEEQLFKSVIDMMTPMIEEKSIEFNFKKINVEWHYMLLDEQRVKQIFVNLLSNAVKFTPNGGRVDFIMELVSQTDNMIRDKFVVRDNGIGMSREFLPHIFESFEQEENSGTNTNNGTGLGMPIVKQLVELMGGSVTVESEKGKGTEVTVYINFPLAKPSEKTKDDGSEDSCSHIPEGICILLCEDHPLNAKIAVRLLEDQGAKVEWAQNGKMGVEMFSASENGHFDIVLMDVRMPLMDGLSAAKAIRALERSDAKSIPIIAVTANAYEDDIKRALDAGMNEHLAKPLEVQRLCAVINKYCKKN